MRTYGTHLVFCYDFTPASGATEYACNSVSELLTDRAVAAVRLKFRCKAKPYSFSGFRSKAKFNNHINFPWEI